MNSRRVLTAFAVAIAVPAFAHAQTKTDDKAFVTGGKVVANANRGKIGLAKVGLTPKGLEAQEKCK